jgi:hypothetical protein
MDYSFTGVSRLTCEPVGTDGTKLKSVEIALEMSKGLDRSKYMDADGELTAEGIQALSSTYIHGLAACVKLGEEAGCFTLEQAKEIIITELQRAVAAPTQKEYRDFKP